MTQITGTIGADTLTGTAGDDVIEGLGGTDQINGGSGNDVLLGGDGNDIVEGGSGDDSIEGGEGQDSISDYDGDDLIYGGGGNDVISVGRNLPASSVYIEGGTGDDQIYYYDYLSASHAFIDAGAGNDRISLDGHQFGTELILGQGQDTIVLYAYLNQSSPFIVYDFAAGASGDRIDWLFRLGQALTGWDTSLNPFGTGHLSFRQDGVDAVLVVDPDGPGGGSASDLIIFKNLQATTLTVENLDGYSFNGSPVPNLNLTGTANPDQLTGNGGNDLIQGELGSDVLRGRGGDDHLLGGGGLDQLYGGPGDDWLEGGDGNDFLQDDGGGNDLLDGGAGDDSISLHHLNGSFPELVTMRGGDGNDSLYISSYASGTVTVDAGSGDDQVQVLDYNSSQQFTFGTGKDTLTFFNSGGLLQSTRVVTDFETGTSGDVVRLENFLISNTAWDPETNPFGSNVLRLVQSGSNSILQINLAGWGFVDLLVFQGRSIGSFVAANFGGFSPDGAPPVGVTLTGTADSDTLTGGGGNDTIDGLGGPDSLQGAAGDDVLRGGDGDDGLYGGFGDDIIEGGAGNDYILEDGGSDSIDGGTGNDTISLHRIDRGVEETVSILGGEGNDSVTYQNTSEGSLTVDLGAGADRIQLWNNRGETRIILGSGGDLVDFGQFDTELLGEFSISIADYVPRQDHLVWGSFFTREFVNWSEDTNPFATGHLLLSQEQDDVVLRIDLDGAGLGYAPIEFLTLEGVRLDSLSRADFEGIPPDGSDLDRIRTGGDGDDVMLGAGGNDRLTGLGGNDSFTGLQGNDLLDGGAGQDSAIFSENYSHYQIVSLGPGRLQVSGPEGVDLLTDIERLVFDDGVFATMILAKPQAVVAPIFGASGGWINANKYPRTLGDINGDGFADLVGFGETGVFAALSDGNGAFGPMYFAMQAFAPGAGGWTNADKYPRVLADINGDGSDDLVGFGEAGVFAALSNGNGTFGSMYFATQAFGASQAAGGWTSADKYPRTLADVNGDGAADLVGFGEDGVYVALSNGNGTFGNMYRAMQAFAPSAGGWISASKYPRMLADINGDGSADIIGFGESGVFAALSNGDGTFGNMYFALQAFTPSAGGWTDVDKYPRIVADINGDGFADLIGFGDAGAYVALANGQGGFTRPAPDIGEFGVYPNAGAWTSFNLQPRVLGDVNGDGQADLVGYGDDGVQVVLSTDVPLTESSGQLRTGNPGSDSLVGTGGVDVLNGDGGSDTLDGAGGLDIAVFSGNRFDYSFTNLEPGRVRVSGPDGVDQMTDVERVVFDDGVFATMFFAEPPELVTSMFGTSSGWTNAGKYPRTLGDINGDGLDDLIGFGEVGVFASLATGVGTFGDMYYAMPAFAPSAGGWTDANQYPRLVADINGDGADDLIGFHEEGVYAALATGVGTFGDMYYAMSAFAPAAGGWTNADKYPRTLADINGDGAADIVGFGESGVFAALSNGDGTFGSMLFVMQAFGASQAAGGWTSADKYPRMLADINGDGYADIVGFGEAGVFAALSNGDGTFGNMYFAIQAFGASQAAGGWTSMDTHPRTVADVNGDGLVDLIGFGNAGLYVALSNGFGGFKAPTGDIGEFGSNADAGGWTSFNLFPRALGDVNGDGKADLIGFHTNGMQLVLNTDLMMI